MDNVKIVKDLGLPEQEAEAYLALLRLGGSLASTVAKEMGVKRTTVYAILQSLARKNLVLVYFRKSRRFYHPVPPRKLADMFEKKLDVFRRIAPSLMSIDRKTAQVFGLRFLETKEDLKQFYLDVQEELKKGRKEIYGVISSSVSWENIDREFFMEYRKERKRLGIKSRMLFSEDSKETVDILKEPLRKYKFLPKTFTLESSMNIYHDKVLLVDVKLDYIAVLISIPSIVATFKSVFDLLWEMVPAEK
ncbi:MAG: helix-turn-helix domain-containing protein [Candidatus Moranbacteria bacterium]|nr:helix-turn-helix domain-containing protein [Candidatus Moranbacteria bacterium]